MGSCFKLCSGGSTSDWDYSTRKEIEPHPEVFQVLECSEGTNYLYVVAKYPHCTNFEGEKVLVMKDTSKTDVLLMKALDPHFYEDNKIVARFKPDEEGKRLAKLLAGVQYVNDSWKSNPDKSGGSFTDQEINENGWK